MIFTIPFVPGFADYAKLAAEISRRGTLKGHSLLVVSDADDADAAYDFGQEIHALFDRASFTGVNYNDGKPGAVRQANDLFFAAMRHLKDRAAQPGEPDVPTLLYSDPRSVPQKGGWMKDICAAYYACGAPDVFGARAGDSFEGPIVIAKPFVVRSALVNFLNGQTHWRAYLASELLVNHRDTRCMAGDEDSVLRPASAKKPGGREKSTLIPPKQ